MPLPKIKIVTEKEVLKQANRFQEIYKNKVDEGQELRGAVQEPAQQDAGFAVEKIDLEALAALGVNGLRISSKTFGFVLMQRLTTPGTILNVEIGGQVLSLGPGSKIRQPSQQARITLAPESTAQVGTAYLLKLQTPLIDYDELSPLFIRKVGTLYKTLTNNVEPSLATDGIGLEDVADGGGWHVLWNVPGSGSGETVVAGTLEVWAYESAVGWFNTGIEIPLPSGTGAGISADFAVLVPYGRVYFVARDYECTAAGQTDKLGVSISKTVESTNVEHFNLVEGA